MVLLTVRQVCERLSISRTTLYQLFDAGQIESVKIGRARRIPESEVERFISERLDKSGAL